MLFRSETESIPWTLDLTLTPDGQRIERLRERERGDIRTFPERKRRERWLLVLRRKRKELNKQTVREK